MIHEEPISDRISSLNISRNFDLSDFQNSYFLIQIAYDLKENFAQIHLPNRQFYLPQTVG